MAFIDTSNTIALDATLTELGRKRMAEGRFKVTKFTFGDDEVDVSRKISDEMERLTEGDAEQLEVLFHSPSFKCIPSTFPSLTNALEGDHAVLSELNSLAEAVTPGDFSKYRRLLQLLAQLGVDASADSPRVIIFSERIATLKFLLEHLREELGAGEEAFELPPQGDLVRGASGATPGDPRAVGFEDARDHRPAVGDVLLVLDVVAKAAEVAVPPLPGMEDRLDARPGDPVVVGSFGEWGFPVDLLRVRSAAEPVLERGQRDVDCLGEDGQVQVAVLSL